MGNLVLTAQDDTLIGKLLFDNMEHLGITDQTERTRLYRYVASAIDYIERETDETYRTTTWTETREGFPPQHCQSLTNGWGFGFYPSAWGYGVYDTYKPYRNTVWLAKHRVASITSLTYYDTANASQTLTLNTDFFAAFSTRGQTRLEPKLLYWPYTFARPDAVTITYVCGGKPPAAFLQAVRLLVGSWNENREAEVISTGIVGVVSQMGLDRLLENLRSNTYA